MPYSLYCHCRCGLQAQTPEHPGSAREAHDMGHGRARALQACFNSRKFCSALCFAKHLTLPSRPDQADACSAAENLACFGVVYHYILEGIASLCRTLTSSYYRGAQAIIFGMPLPETTCLSSGIPFPSILKFLLVSQPSRPYACALFIVRPGLWGVLVWRTADWCVSESWLGRGLL